MINDSIRNHSRRPHSVLNVQVMLICPSPAHPFNFSDPCVRQAWSSFLPLILVFLICLVNILIKVPMPVRLNQSGFNPFLNLNDAIALDAVAEKSRRAAGGESLLDDEVVSKVPKPPLWRTFLLCIVALLETLAWIAYGSFRVIMSQKQHDPEPALILPFILALPWLYALFRPLLKPPLTPPYDLFVLYLAHLSMGVIMLGAVLFNHTNYDLPLPDTWALVGLVANLVLLIIGLVLIVSVRMAIPPKGVSPDDIVCTHLPYYVISSLLIICVMTRVKRSRQKIIPPSGVGSPSAGSTHSSTKVLTLPSPREGRLGPLSNDAVPSFVHPVWAYGEREKRIVMEVVGGEWVRYHG